MSNAYRVPEDPHYIGGFNWRGLAQAGIVTVIGNWVITQWLAYEWAWQPALGKWYGLIPHTKSGFPYAHDIPVYQPLAWAAWVWENIFSAVDMRTRWLCVYAIGAFLVTLITGAGVMALSNMARTKRLSKNAQDIKGSARWATEADVRRTGLMGSTSGVYVGGWQDNKQLHYLRHNGPEHVLAFAPTRSGKGVGLVIPTLLAWEESAVIYDIKGENWALTSGFRANQGHLCFRFSPCQLNNSSRFNPLAEIRLFTPFDVKDAQNIAHMIIFTGENSLTADEYWEKAAVKVVTGLILHVCYVAATKKMVACFGDLAYAFARPEMSFRQYLQTVVKFIHDPADRAHWTLPDGTSTKTHPLVATSAREMLNKEDKDFSGVLSNATTALTVFDDPLVRANTSASDFRISDLVNHPQPASLYIVIPPSDKERLRPLVRLIFTLIVNRLTESMAFEGGQQRKNRHRLLLLIDEFPSLKRMDLFADALSYMAGYGLKAYLIAQDVRQLTAPDAYGTHESIVSNCHIRVGFAPNQVETAELLSRMCGAQTIPRASYSFSGNRGAAMYTNVSASVDYIERSLLNADEVQRLPQALKGENDKIISGGAILVFVSGHNPIQGTQMLYFRDPILNARTAISPPVLMPFIDEEGNVTGQPPAALTANRISAVETIQKDQIPPDEESDGPPVPVAPKPRKRQPAKNGPPTLFDEKL